MESPDFGHYLPWLTSVTDDAVQKASLIGVHIPDEAFKSFPDADKQAAMASYKEFREASYERLTKALERMDARAIKIDPALANVARFNGPNSDHAVYSLIEWLDKRLGGEDEFWRPGLSGSLRQNGGNLLASIDFRNELIKQLVERDPQFERFVIQTGDKHPGRALRISPEGIDYLEKNASKIVGNKPLIFSNTPHRYAIPPEVAFPVKSGHSCLGTALRAIIP